MSYLGSIVARATGTAPLLQPRLASRYELEPRAADGTAAEIDAVRDAALAPVMSAAPLNAAVRQVPSATLTEAPASEHTVVRQEIVHEVRELHPHRETALPPPERILDRRTERVESHERVIRTISPSPEVTSQPSPQPSAPREEAPRIETHEWHEDAPLRVLLRPPPAAIHAALNARSEKTAPPVSDDPASAPTIRVTIGRVDVRAVDSQPAKPQRAPRTPAFTLDDYVRLRKEGKRR
jgi:hypothetical protein